MTDKRLASIRTIIAEELEIAEDKVRPEATFVGDLGADSLGVMEVVMAIEDAFELQIPEQDVENLRTVQDAIEYIASHAR